MEKLFLYENSIKEAEFELKLRLIQMPKKISDRLKDLKFSSFRTEFILTIISGKLKMIAKINVYDNDGECFYSKTKVKALFKDK